MFISSSSWFSSSNRDFRPIPASLLSMLSASSSVEFSLSLSLSFPETNKEIHKNIFP
jgi:hypothetical protein